MLSPMTTAYSNPPCSIPGQRVVDNNVLRPSSQVPVSRTCLSPSFGYVGSLIILLKTPLQPDLEQRGGSTHARTFRAKLNPYFEVFLQSWNKLGVACWCFRCTMLCFIVS
jgi:hypothetical protein